MIDFQMLLICDGDLSTDECTIDAVPPACSGTVFEKCRRRKVKSRSCPCIECINYMCGCKTKVLVNQKHTRLTLHTLTNSVDPLETIKPIFIQFEIFVHLFPYIF